MLEFQKLVTITSRVSNHYISILNILNLQLNTQANRSSFVCPSERHTMALTEPVWGSSAAIMSSQLCKQLWFLGPSLLWENKTTMRSPKYRLMRVTLSSHHHLLARLTSERVQILKALCGVEPTRSYQSLLVSLNHSAQFGFLFYLQAPPPSLHTRSRNK